MAVKEKSLDAGPLAEILERNMEASAITRKEFAANCGVGADWIRKIVKGDIPTLSLEQVDKILTRLDIPLELVYPYDDEEAA